MLQQNIYPGNEITLVTPIMEKKLTGTYPKTYKIKVGNCFHAGLWDMHNATMSLNQLSEVFQENKLI